MIIKNLFNSIEFTPRELEELMVTTPIHFKIGIIRYIKDKFGLDLLPRLRSLKQSKTK